jgi:hypothetical protein
MTTTSVAGKSTGATMRKVRRAALIVLTVVTLLAVALDAEYLIRQYLGAH